MSQVKTSKWQFKELKCVVKYMIENGSSLNEIRKKLGECCEEELKYLNDELRLRLFNRIIQQARKEEIIKNKKITIYNSEINIIKSLQDINLEKTLFILLIYSKWLGNMEWFSLMRTDIYKEAKLTKLNSANKQKVLTALCSTGLLKSDVKRLRKGRSDDKKQMWNIPFLQDSGEIAFEFDDFTNVVYRYLNYVYGGYFECQNCGGMFEKKSNRQKSCSKCAPKNSPIRTKIIQCAGCGKKVVIDSKNNKSQRCAECQKERNRENSRLRKQRERLRHASKNI